MTLVIPGRQGRNPPLVILSRQAKNPHRPGRGSRFARRVCSL
jgi:hypothetical protein